MVNWSGNALINPSFLFTSLSGSHRCAKPNVSGATPPSEPFSDEAMLFAQNAFPEYLQERTEASDFCSMLEEAKAQQSGHHRGLHKLESSSVWRAICREAQRDAKDEPLLSSFLYASILSHESFERSLAFVLANRLSDTTLLPTELFEVFYTILKKHSTISDAALADLCAVRERVSTIEVTRMPFLSFQAAFAG